MGNNAITSTKLSKNSNSTTTPSSSNKSSISGNNMNKMTLVEELLCAVAKLYGVVDTVLVIFYEDLTEGEEESGDGEIIDETTDTVDSGVECKEDLMSSPSPDMVDDVSLIF